MHKLIQVISAFVFILGISSAQAAGQSDEAFVVEAARGTQADIDMAKMASEKAANPQVKQLGQTAAKEHQEMYTQLQQFAAKNNIALSADKSGKKDETFEQLSKLNGAQFDRQFIESLIAGHQECIQKLENQSKSTQNAELKQWIETALKSEQKHLQMAQDIQRTLAMDEPKEGEKAIDVSGERKDAENLAPDGAGAY